MNIIDNFLLTVKSRKIPYTAAIIVASILFFVIDWFSQGLLLKMLYFSPVSFTSQPYSVFTYPLIGNGLMGVIFMGYWMWWIGGTLENELGSLRYFGFWLTVTLFAVLGYVISSLILNINQVLIGLYLPTAALTVAWGMRYPNQPIQFMLFLPMTGKWLAIISAIFVFFGSGTPLVGLCALLPLIYAYLYASNKIPFLKWSDFRAQSRTKSRKEDEIKFKHFIDSVYEKQKDREEKERLRKLFERSFRDDEKNRPE